MAFAGYQPSFVGGVIGPSLFGRVELNKYAISCKQINNMMVLPQGGLSKRPGLKYVHEFGEEARLIPFIFNSNDQNYALVFANYQMYVAYNGGMIKDNSGQVLAVATPFSLAQVKSLSYAQCADLMYFAHADLPPYKLSRYSHNNWRFTQVNFNPPPAPSQALVVTRHIGGDRRKMDIGYIYTYVDAAGNESLPGGEYFANIEPIMNADENISIAIAAVAGASEYRLYKWHAGSYGYMGSVLPENIGKPFVDDNIIANTTIGPPKNIEYFQSPGNYPSQVCFYQQRLIFAASKNQPQTVWMSRSGLFENFTNNFPIADDGAIEITIASSEVAMPVWLIVLRSLVLGTGGGVWEIASRSELVTPGSLSSTPQNYRGCEAVRPVVIGNRIIYVMRGGGQVFELGYDFGADAYADSECSILAPHLFAGKKVLSMVYQAAPYSTVWFVMDDGGLLSLTFIKEQDVYAWASHNTAGKFLSLCALPGAKQEMLYAFVKRGEKYFLEMMAEAYTSQSISEVFFVDCGATYSGPPTTVISGLGHLEGQSVQILADGAAHPPRVVNGGRIHLQHPAGIAQVGLGFAASMETLPAQVVDGGGSSVGMRKRISSVSVLFYKTVTCQIGVSDYDETAWRSVEPYGQAIAPKTWTLEHSLSGSWRDDFTVRFLSDKPLPLTILSLAPKVDIKS